MASLRYSQIRAHPDGTINYIANKDKMISTRVHNVANVLNYMGEPESSERVYSFARYCSCNPDLAAKQMELYRSRYYEGKKGGVQGLKEDKDELLGLHFFMSYTEEDDPSEETMNDILTKLTEHPLLNNYAVFGANHFDKKHKHTHFYVCQYAVQGKPKKMCMRYDDYNNLRRYTNYLCVEHGLSIIDLATLRHNDPEYSEWIDGVIAEGKVVVHPEREEHKGAKRQKATTQEIYYKWLKETEEFNAEQERLMTAKQLSQKRAQEKYFWNFRKKGEPQCYYPVSGQKGKYYSVQKYDEYGRKRSLLELIVILVIVIYQNEMKHMESHNPQAYTACRAKVDYKVQRAYNCILTAREMNVNNPNDVPARLKDIGIQMNALKRERRRHKNSIKRHEEIMSAWKVYHCVRPDVEGVRDPQSADVTEYKKAYAILAHNQVLTTDAFSELHTRYLFEKRKVSDYDRRLPELKRQYHDLKYLEALSSRPQDVVDEIYRFTHTASPDQSDDLDSMIKAAEAKNALFKTDNYANRGEHYTKNSHRRF